MELQEHNDNPLAAAIPSGPRARAELALAVGVDASTVWRWAEGRSIPRSHGTRVAIAKALKRPVSELWPAHPAEATAPASDARGEQQVAA